MAADTLADSHSSGIPSKKAFGTWQRFFQWIPPKARAAAAVGVVVFIVAGLYGILSSGSSVLNLVCQHNLKSADLSFSVDGKSIYSDHISATVKRRFGFLDKKVEGTFSRSFTISSGKHDLKIRVASAPDRFDQTKLIAVSLVSGKEATVIVNAQRGSLVVSYDGPPVLENKDGNPSYAAGFHSVLMTVVGSAASAVIGFMVQEFLRKRKIGLPQD